MIDKHESSGISQRSYSALVWNYSGSVVRMSVQFLIGIILARLLGPEAFGVVAVGWLMIGIGNLVADFGLSAALIQNDNISERDVRFTFTAQVMFGTMLTLVGYFSAKTLAIFFHHGDAERIIQAMAFLFLLQSLGQTAGAVLKRSLNFKAYQAINIASYLSGYLLVGIPCAYYGLGAWSLVVAQLVQSFIYSLVTLWYTKTSIVPAFRPSTPGMFAFGGKVIGANLTSWGILNLDSLVIGRVLGIVDLGIYNRAMALVSTPINALTTSLQGVLFAASSRVQADTTQLKKAYFAATSVIALICLPFAATVAIVPQTVVTALYGEKWLGAIPVLAPLALAMAIHSLLAVVGPVLMAQNKVGLELRAQLTTLSVMIPVLYFTSRQSVDAVAWGVMCIYLLRWLLLVRAILPPFNADWSGLLGTMQWPVLCATVLAMMTFIFDRALQDISPLLRLIADIAIASLTFIFLMRRFGKRMLFGSHGDYLLAAGRLPVPLRRLFGV